MVLGWRRAFCTSVSRETDSIAMDELDYAHNPSSATPKIGTRFAFFTSSSNPSTPRGSNPSLRCRTTAPSRSVRESNNSPRSSNPSSPFSFLKSSLRLCTRRCGLCLQSVKKGQGMATFTAECSHTFHFPCISDHVKKQGSLACPLCSCLWKEMPTLCADDQNQKQQLVDEEMIREKLATRFMDGKQLKVYNDDEPLASLTPKARFIPIPESDENCDEEFHVNAGNTNSVNDHDTDVEVRLLPEAAMIAASRRHETYAVVLKVKAPENIRRRVPIDLVTVVDVSSKITSEKLQKIKRAMRTIVSSLSSSDRLSIVAFASFSKRLLPLRRMTTSGRRAARRIVEAMAVIEGSSNSKDALKKAVKVLEDRREKNPIATVILLSDVINQSSSVSSIRYPIHSLKLGITEDDLFVKQIGNLITVAVQDLRLQLGASPAAIAAVYSRTPQPIVLGSNTVEIGDLSTGEERELLVELKLPSSTVRSHQVLSVRCCYRESSSQEIIYGQQQSLLVPRLTTVRSSSSSIQRLRHLFISARALAESHRLTERNDLTGAYHMLVSARAVIQQSSPAPDNEFILGLEADLTELQRRHKTQTPAQLGRRGRLEQAPADEKGEPLTPTSAWRVADKLAKVAMMRKPVNRVSDLHGFEDARF
ncbi:E3 ubiquitin-protein ligase WAV3-like [Bidens hawaiensis]|uniref:E3 ubiquitin-protein ligase WAV3-like n=1 Tax=Bidens hawaiensis TaxID=980011 RepID=UPI00404926A6